MALLTARPFAGVIGAAGLDYFPPRHSPDRSYDRLAETFPEIAGLRNAEVLARLFGAVSLRDAPAQAFDLGVAAAAWKPDVLINDGIALGVPLTAGTLRLPWATVSPFLFCTIPRPDVPPPFLGLPWQAGRRGRVAAALAGGSAELRLAPESRRWRALARAAHLPRPSPSIRSAGCSPWLYLYPGGPALEYPRPYALPHVHGIGPLTHEQDGSAGPPSRLPRVFVTEGTTHTDLRLSRLALQALGGQEVELLLAIGSEGRITRLQPLPANARAVSYVSYRDALAGAALLITNGGAGSLLAALAAGVPALILPAGLDKAEAAERVAWAGAGLRLPAPARCSIERLREAAALVLGTPSFRQRAAHVGAALLALGGTARAAALLEALAHGNLA